MRFSVTAVAAFLCLAAGPASPRGFLDGGQFKTQGMMVEGIASGSPDGTILASDLYGLRLVKRSPDGQELAVPVPSHLGIVSLLGLKQAPNAMRLWVCGQRQLGNGLRGGILVEADPKTLRVLQVHAFPASDGKQLCNDLDFNGRSIIVTDSEAGRVWRVDHRRFKRLAPTISFDYPNGVAVNRLDQIAFVADSKGITRINLWTGEGIRLLMTDGANVGGIDGLYYRSGALYGIQNMHAPTRFVRIDLGWNQTRGKLQVLANADSRLSLPTTGAIVGNEWWIVADAQFLKLNGGKLKQGETIVPTRLMRLPL
jgi:hypothetical protein